MDQNEMKEALEHDAAQKAAAAGNGNPGEQMVEIPADTLFMQLDVKLGMMGKSVTLGLLDVARTFQHLAHVEANTEVDLEGDLKGKEPKKPQPEKAIGYLKVVEKALELASRADAIGDRGIARKPMTTAPAE